MHAYLTKCTCSTGAPCHGHTALLCNTAEVTAEVGSSHSIHTVYDSVNALEMHYLLAAHSGTQTGAAAQPALLCQTQSGPAAAHCAAQTQNLSKSHCDTRRVHKPYSELHLSSSFPDLAADARPLPADNPGSNSSSSLTDIPYGQRQCANDCGQKEATLCVTDMHTHARSSSAQ